MIKTPFPTFAAALAATVLAACSDAGTEQPQPASDLLAPPPVGAGMQLGMKRTIEAGKEFEYCQYVVLPEAIEVGRFEHRYSPGSHHLLLYTTTLDAEEVAGDLDVFDCATRDDLRLGGIAYAAQVTEGQTPFPAGVAMPFEKGQVVLMQTHYLNASPEPLDADVRLNLWQAETAVEQEAGTLFYYDYSILVPPHAKAKARMHCEVPSDISITFAMSHMHRRGVGYRSWLATEGQEDRTLYETSEWEGVEPLVMDPPLSIAAGSSIDFECTFQNDGDETIIEGPSASKNEMCMFVATYWPRLDIEDEFCARTGSGPIHAGTTTCSETLACFQATDDPIEREACQVATCEASSLAVAALNQCSFWNCPSCPDGADCAACMLENCSDPYDSCMKASCD